MTSDQVWEPYDTAVGQAEESIRATLDQMPHERGRVLSSLSFASGSAELQVESLEAHSRSVVAALRSQPVLPFEVEPDQLVMIDKVT